MANEITHNYTSGSTLYACRFQQAGNVFLTNGASDEVWGTGGRDADDYDVTLTEEGDSGHYIADFDGSGNIALGTYHVTIYKQLGANPTDIVDTPIGQGVIYWDGTAEVTIVAADFQASLLAIIGVTVGGTMTLETLLKIQAAWIAGNWKDKSGSSTVKELLDADDGSTVLLEMTLSETTPQRTITVKI